jgi:RNA polymerase sigma-70 factor, ECF subfamily
MLERTLEDWMRAYQAGDAAALDTLYILISPKLRTIFRAGAPEQEVEELVQETWFQVHRSRHTWRPGELLLPWVYSIARHLRARQYRRTSRRGEVELTDTFSVPPPELSRDFEELIRELPESQREVLILMKVEGKSLEEVALATGASIGSVKQKVHRAYEKLRRILGEGL